MRPPDRVNGLAIRRLLQYPQTSHYGSHQKRKAKELFAQRHAKTKQPCSGYGSGSHSILPATLKTLNASCDSVRDIVVKSFGKCSPSRLVQCPFNGIIN